MPTEHWKEVAKRIEVALEHATKYRLIETRVSEIDADAECDEELPRQRIVLIIDGWA